MKADYERIQKFYFQDNLCDKATQGYVAQKKEVNQKRKIQGPGRIDFYQDGSSATKLERDY